MAGDPAILLFIPLLMSRVTHQGFLPDERALFTFLGLILGLGTEPTSEEAALGGASVASAILRRRPGKQRTEGRSHGGASSRGPADDRSGSVAPAEVRGSVAPTEVPYDRDETLCAHALFQQPWWLDAVAPGAWDAAVVVRDGETVGRLPFVRKQRFLALRRLATAANPFPWTLDQPGHGQRPHRTGAPARNLGRSDRRIA